MECGLTSRSGLNDHKGVKISSSGEDETVASA